MIKFQIYSFKFTLLSFIFFCVGIKLGLWQLDRAEQKKQLSNLLQARRTYPALSNKEIMINSGDKRFYRVKLHGRFDNNHTFLLDNRISNGQVGYEIYTPFIVKHFPKVILVDRGFVPQGNSRSILPKIQREEEEKIIEGFLDEQPKNFTLDHRMPQVRWPLIIESLRQEELAFLLNLPPQSIFPYVVRQAPKASSPYTMSWMTPERHYAYAFQWFALSFTILVLFIIFNRAHSSATKEKG